MKKTAYNVCLTLVVLSFLTGTLLLILMVWFENVLGEWTIKLFVTSGIVFIAAGIACVFLREVHDDDRLKREKLIN